MNRMNNTNAVKQQYATAANLSTRISIHDKYSTNKLGFGNWIFSNYTLCGGMKILELGCGTVDMWKSRVFSNVQKLDYVDSLAVTDIDDMVDYIYSMTSMTVLHTVPKPQITEALRAHTENGVLYVPKEYGMFICE